MLWAIMILTLTLLPAHAMPPTPIWEIISFDSFAHFFVFGVQALLLICTFIKESRFTALRRYAVSAACILTVLFGIAVELLQMLMHAGRQADLVDVLANTIGVGCGLMAFYIIRRLKPSFFRPY